MAERGVILDRTTAERMARATKAYERQPVDMRGPRVPLRIPSSVVLVKVTGNASGGGKYLGRIVKDTGSPATETGNLAETDFGELPATDNALILNAQEVGKSTHDLTTGTPVSKIHVGMIRGKTSDDKIIVAINGDDWEACS
jgi:hypothetical protein